MDTTESKRIPYATWEVDNVEYKLKLTTSQILKLEENYKINLLTIIAEGNIPPLKIMLDIVHASMQKFHHGMKKDSVCDLFDTYIDEGGSQIKLYTDVLMPIFNASGFFTPAQGKMMTENIQEAQEQL